MEGIVMYCLISSYFILWQTGNNRRWLVILHLCYFILDTEFNCATATHDVDSSLVILIGRYREAMCLQKRPFLMNWLHKSSVSDVLKKTRGQCRIITHFLFLYKPVPDSPPETSARLSKSRGGDGEDENLRGNTERGRCTSRRRRGAIEM